MKTFKLQIFDKLPLMSAFKEIKLDLYLERQQFYIEYINYIYQFLEKVYNY